MGSLTISTRNDDDDDRTAFTINSSNDYISPLINSHVDMMALFLRWLKMAFYIISRSSYIGRIRYQV